MRIVLKRRFLGRDERAVKITILRYALAEDVVKVVFDARSAAIGKHLKIFIGYKQES